MVTIFSTCHCRVTFDGRPGEPIVPRYSPKSGRDGQITNQDRTKIEELRSWASTVLFLTPVSNPMTLGELTSQNIFFDLVCQVVYFENPGAGCSATSIIHVWDGTIPGVPSILSSCHSLATATTWRDKVIGKCAKIFVFSDGNHGNNVDIALKVEDYILITNLHLKSKISTNADPSQV